ncbi:MAG: protease modulator HflC [Nitrospinota bacterium]
MKKNIALAVFGAVAAIILFLNPFFILNPVQQAVVVQLGNPVKVKTTPGLYFKIPLIQQVRYFDKRLLDYDSAATEIITQDKKNLLVDNFAKWKIIDPLKFLQRIKTIRAAQARLDDIIYSELRVQMGRLTLVEIVSKKRKEITENVTRATAEVFREYGIEIVDFRIKRADLPEQNALSIFNRMKAERERIAKEYRSEGAEEATKIRAETDKEKVILLAKAYKEEHKIRGEGDAEAARIYADAYNQNPGFYAFSRSLEAYRKSLKNNSSIILSPNSEFLKYLMPGGG